MKWLRRRKKEIKVDLKEIEELRRHVRALNARVESIKRGATTSYSSDN